MQCNFFLLLTTNSYIPSDHSLLFAQNNKFIRCEQQIHAFRVVPKYPSSQLTFGCHLHRISQLMNDIALLQYPDEANFDAALGSVQTNSYGSIHSKQPTFWSLFLTQLYAFLCF